MLDSIKIPLHKHIQNPEPQLSPHVFVAPSAQLIGDVRLKEKVSVWFGSILRADVMPIEVGEESNIQDGCILHATYGVSPTKIGKRVTVGHQCILHGCEIQDLCLIGMGSLIMDEAVIPKRSIVGAGSLVTLKSSFRPGYLILGRPAKEVRALNKEELAYLDKSADAYLEYKTWYA